MSARRKLNHDELRACSAFAAAIARTELTQETIAAEAGVTQSAIGQMARGLVAVPANRAAQFGAILNADPAEISVEFAQKIAPYLSNFSASHSPRTVTAKMIASASQVATEILGGFDPRKVDDSAFLANTINWMFRNGLMELGAADTIRLLREIAKDVGIEGDGGIDRQAIQHLSGGKTPAKRGQEGGRDKGRAA
ncbi:helix-turn-helix transcriptional regulator [Luteimonas sp. SHGZ20W]